ncbi:MAG TPA: PIG-L family deacetylase [Asanoa sp.]
MCIADLGTIASIWAHPDDETFLAGGVMAAAAGAGQRVVCVSASAGERGTDDPVAWPPERLGRVRRWEAAAAMAVLGVSEHHFLDLPDGGLAGIDPAGPVARLAELIADVAPDTVLTFGPDGITYHSDHRTVSRWVDAAWAAAGRPGRLLHAAVTADHVREWGARYEEWGVFMTDDRPLGVPADGLAVRLLLDGPDLDRKIAALTAMHTQTAPSIALLGEATFRTLNAEEAFVGGNQG